MLVYVVIHALGHVAVVLVDLLVEAIVGVLAGADSVTILLLVLAGVFLVLFDGLQVRLDVLIHANDVSSVSRGAPCRTLHGACV